MKTRIGAAVLATLWALVAEGREPDVDGFKAYDLPGFTLVTHDEVTARRIPPLIARIDGVLAQLVPDGGRGGGVPNYILVVSPDLFADYVQPCASVCGAFVPGRFVNYSVITDTRDTYWLRRMIFHQSSHLVVNTRAKGIIPLWFDEGIAMLAERTEFLGAKSILGVPPTRLPGWLRMDELLRIDRTSPERRLFAGCSSASANMQTASWALLHRGIVAEPAFGTQLFTYIDAINDLEPVDKAVQSSFGMSVAELSGAMYLYAEGPLETVRIDGELPPREARATGRKMEKLESLELLADVMFASGFKPQRLAEVVAAARRVAPDSPGPQVLRMRRAALIQNDEALDILLRQMEPELSDPRVARGAALALFERANDQRTENPLRTEQRIVFQQRALDLLDTSLRSRHEDPEAAWAFGMLAASRKQQLGSALQRLLSASERLPMNADLAMATALVYESWGQLEQMILHLMDVERFSRSAKQRLWARQRIEDARKN